MADSFKDIFGQTPGQLGVGAAGTFAGGALNYFFNSKLQDKQFAEQEKLQRNAAKLNAQAVQNQAQLQAQGMTNAGLNPAQVTGAGAPSVQAGAAAGANTQLASIFQGVAEIVAASKAPSEVTRNISEAGKADAEAGKATQETAESATRTSTLIPAQVEQLKADAAKVVEETRSAKNANDAWEAEDKYLRKQTQTVFYSVREQLQNSKRWEKLPQDVRIALDNLAEGNDRVGKGEYEAIMKELKLRGEFSDAELKLMDNALNFYVKSQQLDDKDVRKALVQLPKNQQDELLANIKHLQALRSEIFQGKIPLAKAQAQDITEGKIPLAKAQAREIDEGKIPLAKAQAQEITEGKIPLEKAQAALADMQKLKTEVDKKIAELNDALYLADEGRERELDNLTTRESLNNLYEILKSAISAAEMILLSEINARRTAKEIKKKSPPKKVFDKSQDLAPDDNPIFKDKRW